MPLLTRAEVWSDVECAGGTCLGFVPDLIRCQQEDTLEAETLTVTIPNDSPAVSLFEPERIIRLRQMPAWEDFECIERRIGRDRTSWQQGTKLRTFTARGVLADLGVRALVARRTILGTVEFVFNAGSLTLQQHLDTYLLPALAEFGYTWWVAGNVDFTYPFDFTYSNDTVLTALRRMGQGLGLEVQARPLVDGSGHGTAYAIDLVTQIGAALSRISVTVGKEVQTFDAETSVEDQANVIAAFGGTDQYGVPATMGGARWVVAAMDVAADTVRLTDPRGGPPPVQFDGQFDTGYALRWRATDPPMRIIGSFAGGTVKVASVANLQAAPYLITVGSPAWIERWYPPLGPNVLTDPDAEAGTVGQTAVGWSLGFGANRLTVSDVEPHTGTQHFATAASRTSADYQRLANLQVGECIRAAAYIWAVDTTGVESGNLDLVAEPGCTLELLAASGAADENTATSSTQLSVTGGSGIPRWCELIARVLTPGAVRLVARAFSGHSEVGTDLGVGTIFWDGFVLERVANVAGWVTELERPDQIAGNKRRVATINRPDIPDTINIVPNGAFRTWVPATGTHYPQNTRPLGWSLSSGSAAGSPTVVPDTDPLRWKTGGASARVYMPAGSMLITLPVVQVTATPLDAYISVNAQLYVDSGQILLEFYTTRADGGTTPDSIYYPQQLGLPVVMTDGTGMNWFTLTLGGFDLINHNLGGIAVVLRAVTDFRGNIDLVQVTQTPAPRPLAEGAAPTALWQAANTQLENYGTPAIGLSGQWLDLETALVKQTSEAALRRGVTVQFRDPSDEVLLVTRILGITRDWAPAAAATPGVTLAQTALGLTHVLTKPQPVQPPPAVITRGVEPRGFREPVLDAPLTIWQNFDGLLAVVAPGPSVASYRLYRRKGAWPTVDGTSTGELHDGFFVCERSMASDGGGRLANGQPCPGGPGYPVVNTDPNFSTGWAPGDVAYFIAVPRWGEQVGARALTSYTVASLSSTFPLPHGGIRSVLGVASGNTTTLTVYYIAYPLALSVSEAANVVVDLYESVDGDMWRLIAKDLPLPQGPQYTGTLGGRGAGYVPGSASDPVVTWRWKAVSHTKAGATISSVVSAPYNAQALRLAPSIVREPMLVSP